MKFHTFFIDSVIIIILLISVRYFLPLYSRDGTNGSGTQSGVLDIENVVRLCNDITVNELEKLDINSKSMGEFLSKFLDEKASSETGTNIFHNVEIGLRKGIFNNDINSTLFLSTSSEKQPPNQYLESKWFNYTIEKGTPWWTPPYIMDNDQTYYIRYNVPFYHNNNKSGDKKKPVGVISFVMHMKLYYYY